jgi:DNA-binding CsgD family transcriptional regulator
VRARRFGTGKPPGTIIGSNHRTSPPSQGTAGRTQWGAVTTLWTPALTTVAHPLPLTDREREIVTLAAYGMSNRKIADRLAVSVRTVEGHLYRAGGKLGVSDRSELRSILEGRPVE